MMIAGPISPRIVQDRHAQRTRSLIEKSLLRTAVEPFSHHQNARPNQKSRPKKLRKAVPGKTIKILEQQQQPGANQQDRPNGALFRKSIERVRQNFAKIPWFRNAMG